MSCDGKRGKSKCAGVACSHPPTRPQYLRGVTSTRSNTLGLTNVRLSIHGLDHLHEILDHEWLPSRNHVTAWGQL